MTRCFCLRSYGREPDDTVQLYLDIENDNDVAEDALLDETARTPLHWAAATGQSEALQTLLDLDVDPSAEDVDGCTPLDYARQLGHSKCVQILEEKLEISSTPCRKGSSDGGKELTSSNKARWNPLGFLVDLFKPRKPLESCDKETSFSGPHHTFSANDNCRYSVIVGGGGGGEDCREETPALNNNASASSDWTHNDCFDTIRCKVVEDNLKRENEDDAVTTPNKHANEQCDADVFTSLLSTPKRQRGEEVLRSIERLRVSRNDNPAVLGKDGTFQGECELSSIAAPPNSRDISLGHVTALTAAAAVVLPSSGDSDSSSGSSPTKPVDHHLLIRSPPPMLRRDHSGKPPEPSPMYHRLETDWASLEETAAQILALHKDDGAKPSTDFTQSPLMISRDSRLGAAYVIPEENVAESSEEPSTARSPPKQLAPLKGPVPKFSALAATKRLESLRQERSATYRPPSPPGWPCQRKNSILSTSSSEASKSPTSNHRKKKKKKKLTSSFANFSSDLHDSSSTNNVVHVHSRKTDPEPQAQLISSQVQSSSSPTSNERPRQGSPKVGVSAAKLQGLSDQTSSSSSTSNTKEALDLRREKLALNKSIHSLLH